MVDFEQEIGNKENNQNDLDYAYFETDNYNSLQAQIERAKRKMDNDISEIYVNRKSLESYLDKSTPESKSEKYLAPAFKQIEEGEQLISDLTIEPRVGEEFSGHYITGTDEPPERGENIIAVQMENLFSASPLERRKTEQLIREEEQRKLQKLEEFPYLPFVRPSDEKPTIETTLKEVGLGHLYPEVFPEKGLPSHFISPSRGQLNPFAIAVDKAVEKAEKHPGSAASKTAIFIENAVPETSKVILNSAKSLGTPLVELGELAFDILDFSHKWAPVALGYTFAIDPSDFSIKMAPPISEDEKRYGISLWSDIKDLAYYDDKRFGGWDRFVERNDKINLMSRAMLPDNFIAQVFGMARYGMTEKERKYASDMWKFVKDAVTVPEEEMTDFYRGLYVAGMFASFGGAKSAQTLANSFMRNVKKANIIKDVVKGTGQKYPSVRIYTDTRLYKQELPEEEAYWNRVFKMQEFKSENVKMSMMSDNLIHQKYREMLALHGDPKKAAKFTKSIMQDYHMGIAAMASANTAMMIENWGQGGREPISDLFTPIMDINRDGTITQKERKQFKESQNFWPEIFGMAGAFAYPTIGQKFIGKNLASLSAKLGSSKTLSAVGNFVAHVTPVKEMITILKEKGISPSDAIKNSTRAALLYSKGFTKVDLQQMQQRAISDAAKALRIRDELAETGGYVKSNAERDAITDQLKNDNILNKDGSVNKWRYAEEYANKNVKAAHVDYLRNLLKYIDELSDESVDGKASPRQRMYNSIKTSFKALDDLAERVPSKLGNVDFLLGHMLQLNVIQSLKSVLTEKINASAMSGKMISNFALIPDIQKYARQEADLIKGLSEIALTHGKSVDEVDRQFYDSLKNITKAANKKSIETNRQIEQIIQREGLNQTDILTVTPEERKIIDKLLRVVVHEPTTSSDRVSVTDLRENIRNSFFGEDGLYPKLVTSSNEAYTKVKTEANKLDLNIDISEAIDILSDPKLPSGVSQAFASILGKTPVSLTVLKKLKQTTSLNTIEEITDVVGDDLKEQIRWLNDHLLRSVDNEEAIKIAAKLEVGSTNKQLQSIKNELIEKIQEKNAAPFSVSMPDFVELKRKLSEISRKDLESGKTSNQDYYNLSPVIKSLSDSLEEYPELSSSFKEANENWMKTILPFRDNDSPFYKIFINRNPDKGRISSENLLLEIIKHPNQEATQRAYNQMTKDMSDDEKQDLARLFVYSMGNAINKKLLNDRQINNFMSSFHNTNESGFSIFKGTDVEEYANALKSKGKSSLVANKENEQAVIKASSAIRQAIDELKTDRDLSVPTRLINEMLGTGKQGTKTDIDPTTFTQTMLGLGDRSTTLPLSPVTKEEFLDKFRSNIRKNYGYNDPDIDRFINETPRLRAIEQNIIDAFKLTDDGIERFNPILFMKNHLKETLPTRAYNDFIESLKVLTTDEILKIGFPEVNVGELSFYPKTREELRRMFLKRGNIPKYRINEVLEGVENNNSEVMDQLKELKYSNEDLFKSTVNFDRTVDPASMSRFLKEKRPVLKEIFDEEHLETLDALIAPMAMIKNLQESGKLAMSSIQSEWTVPQALGKANSIVRGFLSPRYAITEFGIMHFRQSQFQIMRELFNDKIFAETFKDIFEAGNKGTGVPQDSLAYWSAKMIAIQSSVQARLENHAEENGIPRSALYEKITTYTVPRLIENFDDVIWPFSAIEEYKKQEVYGAPPLNTNRDVIDFMNQWLPFTKLQNEKALKDSEEMLKNLQQYGQQFGSESELNISPDIENIFSRRKILEQEYGKSFSKQNQNKIPGLLDIKI